MSRKALPPLRLLAIALLVAFGGNFQLGYQLTVINPSVDVFMRAFNESWQERFNRPITHVEFTWYWAIAVNLLNVGAFLGVMLVSLLAERFGRRNAILIADIPSILGTILMCVWPPSGLFELFVVGRLLVGFHAGLSSGLQPLYLTEIALPAYRGILSSFQEMAILVSSALGVIVGLPVILGNDQFFMLLLALPAIPCVGHVIGMLFLHETPAHLQVTVGNRALAEKAIRFFNGADANTDEMLEEIQKGEAVSEDSSGCSSMPSAVKLAAAVGCVAGAAQTLTGIYAFENFSTSIFVAAGVDMLPAKRLSVVEQIVTAVGVLTSLSFIDRVNRRTLLISMLVACCACNCAFVIIAEVSSSMAACDQGGCSWLLTYLIGAVYVLHSAFFSCGVGQIPWFLASEMVPQAYRSLSETVAMCGLWGSSIITGFVFYPLNQSSVGSLSVLIIFVLPTLFCVLFLFVFMPETRDRHGADVLVDLEERKRRFCKQNRKISKHALSIKTTYNTF